MKEEKVMFKQDFLKRYLSNAPVPLAIERSWECEILATRDFPRPVLDIGCGEGLFAHNLFEDKIDVGLDPNQRELARTKTFGLYDELLNCYGSEVPKEDQSYKTIFSNSVMEHIEEIEPVLKESHRLLADDGTMYLTLPTDKFDKYTLMNQILTKLGLLGLAERWRKFSNGFWAHYHYYTPEEWEEMFDRNGFKVTDKIEYGSKAQCMANDLFTPLCVGAFVVKKTTNEWFLFPKLRKFVAEKIYYPIWCKFAALKKPESGESGLVFFALQRK